MFPSRYAYAVLPVLLLVSSAARGEEAFRYALGKHGKGELKYVNGLPVLTVQGTPEEIGEQTGVLMRHAAPGLVGYFKKLLKTYRAEAAWPVLVKTGNLLLQRIPADYRKELEAGAKASGTDRDLLIVSNTLWDIGKLRGCSAMLVDAGRSKTAQPFFGRNFDFPALGVLHDYSLVVVCRPQGKHAFASVSFPGLLGCTSAMNDRGLALATLDAESTKDGSPKFDLSGVPLILSFRRVLEECTSVDEAVKLLSSVKRTTLMNLMICDKHGGVVIEMTPKNLVVRGPEEGLCLCTNHFRTPGLATSLECERYAALAKSRDLAGIGLPQVAEKLHAVNKGNETIQTMIFEPTSLRLHLAIGKGPSSALPMKQLDLAALLVPAPDRK